MNDMKLPLVSRLISGRDSISFIREGGRILRWGCQVNNAVVKFFNSDLIL